MGGRDAKVKPENLDLDLVVFGKGQKPIDIIGLKINAFSQSRNARISRGTIDLGDALGLGPQALSSFKTMRRRLIRS